MSFAPTGRYPSLHGRLLGLARKGFLVNGKWDGVHPMLVANATAASTAVSNTTTETAFDNTNYSIPANFLRAGSLIKVRWQGIATSTNSTDTLLVKTYFGSTSVATGTATDVADNNMFAGEAIIAVRTIGASGTFVATSSLVKAPAASLTATRVDQLVASTAVDTTAAITISVKATWSAQSASDSVRLDVFTVEIA